jgi:uncharacterized protein YjeT (DUF2065 family)
MYITAKFLAIDPKTSDVTTGTGNATAVVKVDGNLPFLFPAGLKLTQESLIDDKTVTLRLSGFDKGGATYYGVIVIHLPVTPN